MTDDFDTPAFKNWAASQKLVFPESLREKAQDAGAEHEVWFQDDRVFKAAYNPHTVGFAEDGSLTLVPETSVSAYLRRLMMQNNLFDDDIRIEGLVMAENDRIIPIISQPIVHGRKPTMEEISDYMRERELIPVAPHIKGWYSRTENVLIADAHDRNLVVLPTRVSAIDLIICEDPKVTKHARSLALRWNLVESNDDEL